MLVERVVQSQTLAWGPYLKGQSDSYQTIPSSLLQSYVLAFELPSCSLESSAVSSFPVKTVSLYLIKGIMTFYIMFTEATFRYGKDELTKPIESTQETDVDNPLLVSDEAENLFVARLASLTSI